MAAPATHSSLHCTICGDDASAFNFGALSCESCKAFFRRATRSSKVPACVFHGDCVVSLRTRRFCAACRLRKCQTAGMNKRLVLGEQQRRERLKVIEDNRLRKGLTRAGRLRLVHAGQTAVCRPPSPQSPCTGRSRRRTATSRTSPVAAVDLETSVLLLPPPSLSRSVATSPSLPSEQQQQQQQWDNNVGVVRSESVRGWTCNGGVPATAAGVTAPSSINVSPSQCVLSLLEDDRAIVTCDVSWSLWSHEQPATAEDACPGGGSCVCFSEMTALPPSRPLHQVQQHAVAAPLGSSFYRRRLSTQACEVLDTLTTLYKSKLVASRRLSLRRSLNIDVTEMMNLQGGREKDRETRLQQFAARISDLVSGYVLFARELPDVSQLPFVAQMALVKACAPTFILVRAAELYDERRAAFVDELGDIVPMAVVDYLLSGIQCEPEVELLSGATTCCRQFFEIVSTLKRHIPTSGPGGSPDQCVIVLLQAISLLSPELMPPNVVSQGALDALANAQQRHVFLLRQYLEASCSFKEAAVIWPQLLGALEASKRGASSVSDLLLSCSAVRCDDLLAEILDGRPAVCIATFPHA